MERLLRAANASQNWTVTVLNDDTVMNAAATKGNFVFIWTGMLKSVNADGELAAVLGHEIAHVLARHVEPDPAEQMNQALAGVAGAAVGAVLTAEGYGAASDIGGSIASESIKGAIVNPYSQKLELEADHIGMFIMADAGYNPELAVRFWERSAAEGEGGLAFFSTHPSSGRRLESLRRLLPKATARYRESVSREVER
jgi:predicted Zn-dependent protease